MLKPDDTARENEHDITTVAGRRRWIADLTRPHVAAALATLEDLAANAESPRVRRSAERDLKRYRARVAKALKAGEQQ